VSVVATGVPSPIPAPFYSGVWDEAPPSHPTAKFNLDPPSENKHVITTLSKLYTPIVLAKRKQTQMAHLHIALVNNEKHKELTHYVNKLV